MNAHVYEKSMSRYVVDEDELMALAQEGFKEFELEFKAEMRAAGQIPDPRPEEDSDLAPLPSPPRPHRPVGDRIGPAARDIRDRLGLKASVSLTMDIRECHICKKRGHLARNCPDAQAMSGGERRPTTSAPSPGTGSWN